MALKGHGSRLAVKTRGTSGFTALQKNSDIAFVLKGRGHSHAEGSSKSAALGAGAAIFDSSPARSPPKPALQQPSLANEHGIRRSSGYRSPTDYGVKLNDLSARARTPASHIDSLGANPDGD